MDDVAVTDAVAPPAGVRQPRKAASRRRPAEIRAHLPLLVLAVGLAANAVVLLHYSDGIYFWADEFDLLFRRGVIPSENVGLLHPHSGHLMAASILIYRLLVGLFGIDSYTPWAVLQICFHLAICVSIALVLRRVGARPAVATGAALVVAWWGIGANAQIWAAGMNHSGSLLLGLLVVYVVAGPATDKRALLVGAGLLSVAVTFSLTTAAVGVMVAGFAWSRRGGAFAVRLVAVPLVLLTVWFLVYGRDGLDEVNGRVVEQSQELARIPGRVWQGLTLTLDNGLGLQGLGAVLVVLVVACLLTARNAPPGLVALGAAGLVAALVQLGLTAYGRYSDGAELLGSAVYSYITIVLLVPALALTAQVGLSAIRRPAWVVAVVVGVLATAYVAHAVAELRTWHRDIGLVSGGNLDLMLGIATAADADERPLDRNHPDALSPYLLPKYVLAPQIRAALPARPATPQSRLTAESTFFVGVGEKTSGLPPVDAVTVSGLEPAGESAGGCQSYTASTDAPSISFATGPGAEVTVTSDSAKLTTALARGDLIGPTREWSVTPGVATHVATSARDARLTVTFDESGRYTLCR